MSPQKLEVLWLTKEIGLIRGQQIDRSLQLQRRLAAHEQTKVLAVILYTAGVQPLRKPSAHERLLRVRECDSGRLEDEALKLPELVSEILIIHAASRAPAPCALGGPGGALAARGGLFYQGWHVENQCDLAVAEDAGAADAIDLAKQLAQRLDDGLELAQQRIDDQAGPLAGVFDDDDVLAARPARRVPNSSRSRMNGSTVPRRLV